MQLLLLLVFLLTVLPTLCFGLNCHFCNGTDMTDCDANSTIQDCVDGMLDLLKVYKEPQVGAKSVIAARVRAYSPDRGTGILTCLKMRVEGDDPTDQAFGRLCGVDEVAGWKEENKNGTKIIEYHCHMALCNFGEVPSTVPVTTTSKTSGSGRPQLTSLTSWVVFVGFLYHTCHSVI